MCLNPNVNKLIINGKQNDANIVVSLIVNGTYLQNWNFKVSKKTSYKQIHMHTYLNTSL